MKSKMLAAMLVSAATFVVLAPVIAGPLYDSIPCWGDAVISYKAGGATNCFPPCTGGKSCMKHTVSATIWCNAAKGNTSCPYCVKTHYEVNDGFGNWNYAGSWEWPSAPPSPLGCTPGQSGGDTVLSASQKSWCDWTGLQVHVYGGVYNKTCDQVSITDTPDTAVNCYYTP